MQGVKRKIVYVAVYEALGFVVASIGLAAGSGSGMEHAGAAAIMASVIAVLWNLGFNTFFEFVESRLHVHGRSLVNRIIHAVGFEGGLALILAPLFAWWLHISFVHALVLDFGLSLFFMCYTFAYNWAFDRVFGLPDSARGEQAPEAGSAPAKVCRQG